MRVVQCYVVFSRYIKSRYLPFAWSIGVAVLCIGCSSSVYRIKKEAFDSVPYARKMRLYEAEYEIGIAEDNLVAMQERIRDISNSITSDASVSLDDAIQTIPREDRKQLEKEHQVAWKARQVYMEASIDYLQKRVVVQEMVIDWTIAKYELGKALFARRYRLEDAPQDLNTFERQVAQQEKRLRQKQAELQQQQVRLEKLRDNWHKSRDHMMARSVRSFVGLGGDDVPVWELFE